MAEGYKTKNEKLQAVGRRSSAIRKAKLWGLSEKKDIVILNHNLIVRVGKDAAPLTKEGRKLCVEYSHGEMINHRTLAMSGLVSMKLPNPGIVWPGVEEEEPSAAAGLAVVEPEDDLTFKDGAGGKATGPGTPAPFFEAQETPIAPSIEKPLSEPVEDTVENGRIPEGSVLGSDNIVGPDPNPEILSMVALGFTPEQAVEALKRRGADGPAVPLAVKKAEQEPLPENTPPSVTTKPETEPAELVKMEDITMKYKHWAWINAAVVASKGVFTFQDCVDKIIAKAFASDAYRGVKTRESFSGKREEMENWM